MNGVHVSADVITFQNITMSSGAVGLNEVEVVEYEVPLISKDKTQSGGTVTSEEIEKMPEKTIAAVASTVGGVFSRDGEVGSIRGQRSSGTVYYIDGIKVTGTTSLPQSAYDQISVILGGIPAQYGDATGGIISATTKARAVSSVWALSSSLPVWVRAKALMLTVTTDLVSTSTDL